MTPLDDLFSTDESRAEAQLEKVVTLNPAEISDFPNHPFKVKQDEAMAEMVDSVKRYGVLVPALVRPKADGSYEMIVGAGAILSGECRRLFELPGAPSAYAAGMLAYCDFFEALKGDRGLNEASRARIAAFEKPGFRGKRPKKDEDPFLKERMDAQKKAFEAYVDELQGSLSTPPEEIARRQELSSGPLDMLVLMAERFGEAFAEAKRRKNIVDFSDLEHLALSILRETHQRT